MFKICETINSISQPTPADFHFLNFTGRKLFHKAGILGQGEVIAVMDTGVNNHKELEGRILPGLFYCNSDFCSKDPNIDDNGHGTHVAGSIGGINCGVAPVVEILPVKVFDAFGSGQTQDIINACNALLNWRHPVTGQKVTAVNMSFGCSEESLIAEGLFEQYHVAIKALVESGIAVFAAAGNSGENELMYPGAFDEVIEVGACDIEKKIAYFSTRNNEVDVCQIGVDVLSCDFNTCDGYAVMSGTSMATPITTGIGALLASRHRKKFKQAMPEKQLYETIKENTIDIGIDGIDPDSGAGFCCLNPYPVNITMKLGSTTMIVNGNPVTLPVAPQTLGGSTVIPVRAPFENAAAECEWNQTTKEIYLFI